MDLGCSCRSVSIHSSSRLGELLIATGVVDSSTGFIILHTVMFVVIAICLIYSLSLSLSTPTPTYTHVQLPELIHVKEKGCVRFFLIQMANIGFLISFAVLLVIAIYEEELNTLITV